MAPKPPLDVKIEVILDDKNKKYYPGDQIDGKIFITSNQAYNMTNLRLAWTGRIKVQPIQTNKDFRIYFDECWKLGPKITKAKKKTAKDSQQVPYFQTNLVLVADNDSPEPKVELSKNKTVGFTFKVNVPNDRPLPSSTTGSSLNKIIYLLEAFIDGETDEKPIFFGQRVVPVLEAIYTRTEELMKPQRAEQVFMVSLLNQDAEFTSAMRVTLPCRGCQPGIAIPVSITIWNNIEFSRKQGISISLFRVNQVLANGRAYTSPGEKVHRVIADLNIVSDEKGNNQKVQTVRVGLPIPKGTTPTITLEKSELLSIVYFIRVQVFAQEGVYTSTSDGAQSQFMLVDIPFIVGTLASPSSAEISRSTTTNASVTPISSPLSAHGTISSPTGSSIKSPTSSSIKSPTTSPRISNLSGLGTISSSFDEFSFNNNSLYSRNSATTTTNLTSPIASPELSSNNNIETDSVITVESGSSAISTSFIDAGRKSISNSNSRLMGGIFRKSSSGSNTSHVSNEESTERKKKRNVFSRLYGKTKSSPQTAAITDEDNGEEISLADNNNTEQEKDHQIEESQDQATLSAPNQGGGVFNIFPDDDDDDEDHQQPQQSKITIKETKKNTSSPPPSNATGGVFNMFPDDDSDDEEQQQPLKNTKKEGGEVFNMFPDSDSDSEVEDDDNKKYPILGENNTVTDRTLEDPSMFQNDSITNQRLVSSHVFKMFDDSTDEDEEENVQGLSISSNNRVKPNQHLTFDKPNEPEVLLHFDKPNTKDDDYNNISISNNNNSDSSDEGEEDLLTVLAKKEKLHRKIA